MRWANLAKGGTAGVVISMRDIWVSLVSEEWNERDALASLEARQQIGDGDLEVFELLVLRPTRLVGVELEDEEQRRIRGRLVRQEQLHLRLGHRKWRQLARVLGDGVGFAVFRLQHDGDDEALVQGGERVLGYQIGQHSSLHELSRPLWTSPPDSIMSVVKCAVPTGFSTSSSGFARPPGRPPPRPWRRRSR